MSKLPFAGKRTTHVFFSLVEGWISNTRYANVNRSSFLKLIFCAPWSLCYSGSLRALRKYEELLTRMHPRVNTFRFPHSDFQENVCKTDGTEEYLGIQNRQAVSFASILKPAADDPHYARYFLCAEYEIEPLHLREFWHVGPRKERTH
jgi:hypothetical protein